MATPHNTANKKDIAKTVFMAGDPVRVKKMAEKYLTDAKLVNESRGIFTYTGKWKGKRVTFMAHGMGCPSMGVYAHELFEHYGVEKIIRLGTAGALRDDIKIGSIVIAEKSYTKTNFDDFYIKHKAGFVNADKELAESAVDYCKKHNIKYYYGNLYCTDTFYTDEDRMAVAKKKNLIAVEMESAALYIEASKFGKKALTICSISDIIPTGEELDAKAREDLFGNVVDVAFEIAF